MDRTWSQSPRCVLLTQGERQTGPESMGQLLHFRGMDEAEKVGAASRRRLQGRQGDRCLHVVFGWCCFPSAEEPGWARMTTGPAASAPAEGTTVNRGRYLVQVRYEI